MSSTGRNRSSPLGDLERNPGARLFVDSAGCGSRAHQHHWTSGGGFQAAHIAALDSRIKVAAISCYITALPMRVFNRIFKDPDSDPEQDLYGMISKGIDHPGLLLMMYPRPVFVAAAVLDFFPIEGTHQTVREISGIYNRFGHADRIAMHEGYHGHEYSTENQQAAITFLDHFNSIPEIAIFPQCRN